MAKLHIIEGPVGAGKTTYGRHLAALHRTPPLVLDEWMARLFRPDRPDEDIWPWYAERKARLIDQILQVAFGMLDSGNDAIIELGLIQKAGRLDLYRRVTAAGYEYAVYVLDPPKSVRRQRVMKRNEDQGETFAMIVPEDVFEMASSMWEPPDEDERAAHDIKFVESRAR